MKKAIGLFLIAIAISSCASQPQREPQQAVVGNVGSRFQPTQDITTEGGLYNMRMEVKTYTTKDDIQNMLMGFVDNLESRNCPSKLLDLRYTKLNVATGGKLVGLRTEIKVDDGASYFVIYPIFNPQPINGVQGQKCLIKSL